MFRLIETNKEFVIYNVKKSFPKCDFIRTGVFERTMAKFNPIGHINDPDPFCDSAPIKMRINCLY